MITIYNTTRITTDELEALTFASQSLLVNTDKPTHNFDPIARRKYLDIQDVIEIISRDYKIVSRS